MARYKYLALYCCPCSSFDGQAKKRLASQPSMCFFPVYGTYFFVDRLSLENHNKAGNKYRLV